MGCRELCDKPPSWQPHLLRLLNAIYRTGHLPAAFREIHVGPLPKRGKDPRDPGNRRPMYFLNSVVEILERLARRRILPPVEPALYRRQCAYGRARGTEHHLVLGMDPAQRPLPGSLTIS